MVTFFWKEGRWYCLIFFLSIYTMHIDTLLLYLLFFFCPAKMRYYVQISIGNVCKYNLQLHSLYPPPLLLNPHPHHIRPLQSMPPHNLPHPLIPLIPPHRRTYRFQPHLRLPTPQHKPIPPPPTLSIP